ncbi:hypothetical protein EHT25_05940 [Larkinella rosea]|uniref:Uncharacterized protein n=2 Tax=Larkinella rosea TaxID=2025312 RepID=A0A3P1C1Q7_9BACT|nr:hypothetical protein EHT25_05940 [Larkinella rosea]
MAVAPSKPPGRRLIKQMSTRTKWLLLAPFSLVLIGYGLCVFSEAANLKHTGEPVIRWVLLGTYSLIVINAGLSLFGQAIIFRVRIETRRAIRREMKKKIRVRQKKENPVRRA